MRSAAQIMSVLVVLAGFASAMAAGHEPSGSAANRSAGLDRVAMAAKSGGSVEGAELAAFKRAIRAKYDLKERAFAQHDAETIVTQFYAPDVISVGEGEGIFVGRDRIRPLYQDVVKNNKVRIESVHTFVSGDAGWDWADFHVFPTDGKTQPFTFAILFLWARVEGQWICKGDYFMTGSFKEGKLVAPAPSPAGPTH